MLLGSAMNLSLFVLVATISSAAAFPSTTQLLYINDSHLLSCFTNIVKGGKYLLGVHSINSECQCSHSIVFRSLPLPISQLAQIDGDDEVFIGTRSTCHPALVSIEWNTENSEEKNVMCVDEPSDVEEEE